MPLNPLSLAQIKFIYFFSFFECLGKLGFAFFRENYIRFFLPLVLLGLGYSPPFAKNAEVSCFKWQVKALVYFPAFFAGGGE